MTAQHKTEIGEYAQGDEDWTGVMVIGEVPQGCRQLGGVKGRDEMRVSGLKKCITT